jgi:hypothetical protein
LPLGTAKYFWRVAPLQLLTGFTVRRLIEQDLLELNALQEIVFVVIFVIRIRRRRTLLGMHNVIDISIIVQVALAYEPCEERVAPFGLRFWNHVAPISANTQ